MVWWQGLMPGALVTRLGMSQGWEPDHCQAARRKFPDTFCLTSTDSSDAVGEP